MKSLQLIFSKAEYFAVCWLFSSLNFMIGTWILYIPYIKNKLNLSDSKLGIALFCLSLGVMIFLTLVPFFSRKLGIGRATFFAVLLFSVAFAIPFIVSDFIFLCVSLFFVGAFLGTTDVAMNTLVSEIEKRDNSNFMSAAHGFFSLGGVLGAGIGTLVMSLFSKPLYHMIFMGLFIALTSIILRRHYINNKEQPISKEDSKSRLIDFKPLFVLAFIAFVIMSSEGAIEHWSTLYLLEVVKITEENLAGLGFILFSITMTIGRFFGDIVSEKMGSIKVILLGCILASFGYFAILTGKLEISLFGFANLGLGLSVIIPELFRLAGKTKGLSTSKSISFVSGVGFLGFLLGPVILGFVSDAFGLKSSFILLSLMTFAALIISLFGFLKKSKSFSTKS